MSHILIMQARREGEGSKCSKNLRAYHTNGPLRNSNYSESVCVFTFWCHISMHIQKVLRLNVTNCDAAAELKFCL